MNFTVIASKDTNGHCDAQALDTDMGYQGTTQLTKSRVHIQGL